MPIYEYACKQCGHQFERWQKISASKAPKCEACGHRSSERLISGTSFSLKGSGWYADGYSSGSTAGSSGGD